jgi:hypothetical protein
VGEISNIADFVPLVFYIAWGNCYFLTWQIRQISGKNNAVDCKIAFLVVYFTEYIFVNNYFEGQYAERKC